MLKLRDIWIYVGAAIIAARAPLLPLKRPLFRLIALLRGNKLEFCGVGC